MDMKLSDLGEEEVVNQILSLVDKSLKGENLPPGDDARDVLIGNTKLIVSIDGYSIKSVKLPWRSISDVGWCAVTSVISDTISKGGYPYIILASIGMPKEWSVNECLDLIKGIRDACNEYNIRFLGGDTNESSDPWISVASIGYTYVGKPPSRYNARPNDYIVVTGYYGAMGVVALDGIEKASKLDWVVRYTRRPKLYTKLTDVIHRHSNYIHASMDVSDGLGYTLYTIAKLSNVSLKISKKPRYYHELNNYCSDEIKLWDYILSGGEEYGVVLSIGRSGVRKFCSELDRYDIPYEVIGRVSKRSKEYIEIAGYGSYTPKRWDQFKGWI